jgi:predicted ATP-dependent Lon-type protease
MADQPLFHQGHYNILAAQIKRNYPTINYTKHKRRTMEEFAISLAKRLKEDNPNFDPIEFLTKCSPNSELYPIQELWNESN